MARSMVTTATATSDCSAIITGALGELMVSQQLTKRGWTVCVPMVGGNASHFDLVATKGELVHRIQVKASSRLCDTGAYVWGAAKGSKAKRAKTSYSLADFDFIILVFVTEPTIYLVMPVEMVSKIQTVKTKAGGKYWPFHERWDLLELAHDEPAGKC